MKVRLVRYERVFPVGQYANERIYWEATIAEMEGNLDVAAEALAQLFERSLKANRAFDFARKIEARLTMLHRRLESTIDDIARYDRFQDEATDSLETVKDEINQFEETATTEDYGKPEFERLQNRLQSLNFDFQSNEQELARLRDQERELKKNILKKRQQLDTILDHIKTGNFELGEDEPVISILGGMEEENEE